MNQRLSRDIVCWEGKTGCDARGTGLDRAGAAEGRKCSLPGHSAHMGADAR
jgi:hypothetical protein